MTEKNASQNLAIGTKVYNVKFENFSRVGEVVEIGGKPYVAFTRDGKAYNNLLGDLWQPLPGEIVSDNAVKTPRATDPAPAPAPVIDVEVIKPAPAPETAPAPGVAPATDQKTVYVIDAQPPVNVLDMILDNPAPKNAPAPAPAPETAGNAKETPETPAPAPAPAPVKTATPDPLPEKLTPEEKQKLKKFESDFFKFDKAETATQFAKGKILNSIRVGKLYRETHETFAAYAFEKLAVTREYAQNLAQIGEFAEIAESFFDDKAIVSVNAVNKFIRNQNKRAENLNLKDTPLADFAPVLKQVIETTIETAKNGNAPLNVTPRIVDTVDEKITATLRDAELTGTPADILTLAARKLAETRETIKSDARAALMATPATKTSPGGSGDALPIYSGPVSTLSINCSNHGETKISSITGGKIRTGCKCLFVSDGAFNIKAIEINGQRVKETK